VHARCELEALARVCERTYCIGRGLKNRSRESVRQTPLGVNALAEILRVLVGESQPMRTAALPFTASDCCGFGSGRAFCVIGCGHGLDACRNGVVTRIDTSIVNKIAGLSVSIFVRSRNPSR
jgi:hypothetical protein